MKKSKSVHGPKELPLIGSVPSFGKDPLQFHVDLYEEFDGYAQYSLLGDPFVSLHSPELIDHVLVKHSSKYIKTIFMREKWKGFFGKGVITADGDEWKRSRKVLQPMVSRDKLSKYFEVISHHSEDYANALKDGEAVDIKEDMMNLMLFSLVKVMFHTELDDEKVKRFGVLFKQCIDYFDFGMTLPGIMFEKFPTGPKTKYLNSIAELEEMVKVLLHSDSTGMNMLTLLKNAKDEEGNPFTEVQIRDNILTFFIAGHETSSMAICYTLFLLGQHPEEVKKIQAELDEVLQGRSPNFAEINNLKTLKNVVNESMRIYPPVGMIGREAAVDDVIGNIPVKKGTNIIIPVFSIHRSAKIYPSPLDFIPDRWNDPELENQKYDFLPFGLGPRVCMGASFAMMEIYTVLAVLLQRFDVKLTSSTKLELMTSASMRPKNDVTIVFKKRVAR